MNGTKNPALSDGRTVIIRAPGTEPVVPDPGTVTIMKTIRDVLGPDYDDPFVSLNWAGRTESAAELAPRIAATTARIAAQYPAGSMQWVTAPDDIGGECVPIPVDTDALTELIDASFDRSLGFRNRTLLSLFLCDDPSDESSTDSTLR